MFAIDNNGELRIRDLNSLNSTEAHIVVMAKDSGVPPRMVSGGVGDGDSDGEMDPDESLPTVLISFISGNFLYFSHFIMKRICW